MLKFLYNGVKIDGVLWKFSWGYDEHEKRFRGYSDVYTNTPKELLDITDDYKNDSDSMSDYHEKDAIYFKESNQYYNTVRECYIQKMTKNFHRQIAWYDRRKIVVSPSTYAEMLQKLDVLSLIPKHAIT